MTSKWFLDDDGSPQTTGRCMEKSSRREGLLPTGGQLDLRGGRPPHTTQP